MRTSWNEGEEELLQGLPLRTQIIYLRGIRRYMDYETGIAGGVKRRISLRSLAEVSQEQVNKQIQEMPTKSAVRASIEQLKRAGLIERIEDDDYLIFFLPKADTHKSVQNNHDTTTTQPRHRDHDTTNVNNDAECDYDNDTTTTQPRHRNHDTHQVSGNQDINLDKKEKIKKEKSTPKPDRVILEDYGISGALADDFIRHRRALKATITDTAMNGFKREAEKAGISIQDAVKESIERGWRGFKAEWTANGKKTNLQNIGDKRNDKFSQQSYGQTVINLPGYK